MNTSITFELKKNMSKLALVTIALQMIFCAGAATNKKDDNIVDIKQLLILRGVEFEEPYFDLSEQSEIVLNAIFDSLNKYQNRKVIVTGYFEKNACKNLSNSDSITLELSKKVTKYLIGKGINEDRIKFKGGGCAKNASNVSRKYKTRIEVQPY